MNTNTDPVRALIDLRDRVLPAAIRYQSVGPGYIEEAQRIVEAALAQQPAAASAPVGVEGLPWELRRRATVVGAVTGVLLNRAADAIDTLSQQQGDKA